jgi:hypothetical protein
MALDFRTAFEVKMVSRSRTIAAHCPLQHFQIAVGIAEWRNRTVIHVLVA